LPLLNLTIDARFQFGGDGRLRVRVLDPKASGLRILDLLPLVIGYRIRKAEKIFSRIATDRRDVHYFQKVVDGFRLTVTADFAPDSQVPQSGPLIIVANHPLNGVDGMAIASVLAQSRPDLRLMLTTTFEGIPGLADYAIFVNASDGPSARNRAEPVREAIAWLKAGHALVVFPAGQGSFVHEPGRRDPVDVPWNKGVATLLKNSEANVLPVFVRGRASYVFLKTRRAYRPLSTLFLLREILIQEGSSIRLRIGAPLTHADITSQGSREQQVDFLRKATYALDKSN
jgi:putative hemolysin